jgi:putative flippase GtrA
VAFTALVTTASVHHQVANAVAYVLGTTNNFFLNVLFNFRTRDRLLARFLSFQAVGLLGLVTSAGILWLLVDRMRIGPIPAKIATLSVVLALQYNLNRLISFRRRGVDAP